MCGIIARIGEIRKGNTICEALEHLEYRGYDSFGVLQKLNDSIEITKDIGSLNNKHKDLLIQKKSFIELGHTRWATHGEVKKDNAHPHFDDKEKVYVVMNGIIENYNEFIKHINPENQSDTKVLAQLIGDNLEIFSPYQAIKNTIKKLKGDFSFIALIDNQIFAYKQGNPLLIGYDEKNIYLCSDINFLKKHSKKIGVLEDNTICIIDSNLKYQFFNKEEKISIEFIPVEKFNNKTPTLKETTSKWSMENEIYQQNDLSNIFNNYNKPTIENISNLISNKNYKNIIITGAGSSYNAGLYLHYLLREKGILSNCIVASELDGYCNLIENSIVFVFSQSGETGDLIRPIENLRQKNQIISIVNTKYSTLDRISNKTIYLECGEETGVAATKSFLSQILIIQMLTDSLENSNKLIQNESFKIDFSKLEYISNKVKSICKKIKSSQKLNLFYIGRDKWYPLALEGALKYKELTYNHAEGFAGGELKHGTLSLIEENSPVIVLGNSSAIIQNAIELQSRGATLIGISKNKNNIFDYYIEEEENITNTIIMIQLFAFHMALLKGNNPDKPRNLAKSVTVR